MIEAKVGFHFQVSVLNACLRLEGAREQHRNKNFSKMEELSIILESKQSELDQKDELVKKVGEFNDTVDKLKVELSETKEERDRLEERIEELEQETREKYEFESQRSGTPPG